MSVEFPDGRVRFDWVPAVQPTAPRGQAGSWHVVTGGPQRPTRWEWHAEDRRPPQLPPAPDPLPPVRRDPTLEVLPDRVYRPTRPMGLWFWLAAVILAAIGGAGAVAMTHEDRAEASLAAETRPDRAIAARDIDDDAKPTAAGLVRVAEGYLNALLDGDVDDLLSYLDPACDSADPGFALAARWASVLADGVRVDVEEVDVHGRRGSVTELDVDGDLPEAARRLITDTTPDGEQAFPWRFTRGEWYFKGECGAPVLTADSDVRTSTVPDGGDDDAET